MADDPQVPAQAAKGDATPSRAATEAEIAKYQAAKANLEQRRLPQVFDANNPNARTFFVAFDGTWNDRDNLKIANVATPTNPATLQTMVRAAGDARVDSEYFRGIGTDGGISRYTEGALGLGTQERARDALQTYQRWANEQVRANPNADLSVNVSGFSRGAASARIFANMLHEQGVPDLNGPKHNELDEQGRARTVYDRLLIPPGRERIGTMLLYDTVTTGVIDNFSIPPTVQSVLHLTAADEKRPYFPLQTAVDSRFPNDPRIVEISLPGAHVDIGGGYDNGLGALNLELGAMYLRRSGLPIADIAPERRVDPKSLSVHDSRTAVDRALQDITPWDDKRPVIGTHNPFPNVSMAAPGDRIAGTVVKGAKIEPKDLIVIETADERLIGFRKDSFASPPKDGAHVVVTLNDKGVAMWAPDRSAPAMALCQDR